MKSILLFIALSAVALVSFAQTNPAHFIIVDKKIVPVVMVQGFKTNLQHLFINVNHIDSLNVIKGANAVTMIGESGKDGLIMIHPKKSASFLQVGDIYKQYQFGAQAAELKVCVNKILLQNPALLLIDKSEIESVEITTDRFWTDVADANTGEKFLNITLKNKTDNK